MEEVLKKLKPWVDAIKEKYPDAVFTWSMRNIIGGNSSLKTKCRDFRNVLKKAFSVEIDYGDNSMYDIGYFLQNNKVSLAYVFFGIRFLELHNETLMNELCTCDEKWAVPKRQAIWTEVCKLIEKEEAGLSNGVPSDAIGDRFNALLEEIQNGKSSGADIKTLTAISKTPDWRKFVSWMEMLALSG